MFLVCGFLWVFVPEVLFVSHVPGCGVTDRRASVLWLQQHGIIPEVWEHLVQAHRLEELLRFFENLKLSPVLKVKFTIFGGFYFSNWYFFNILITAVAIIHFNNTEYRKLYCTWLTMAWLTSISGLLG